MLLEMKRPQEDARALLPVVQHALNHTPSSANGGRAPVTAMTQLEPSNAMNAFKTKQGIKEVTPEELAKWREAEWQELAAARDQLHREVVAAGADKREAERLRRNKKPGVQHVWLDKGDYVLVARIVDTFKPKLKIQWCGPRRITQVLSDWLFDVEDLRDGTVTRHHASRLKLYAAKDAQVTQDLLDHVAYVEGGYMVEKLLDCRFDKPTKAWKIQVKWFGLEEAENTWEEASTLFEDVPVLVRAFLKADGTTSKKDKKTPVASANRVKCATYLSL
jgi:hypothetical protein